MNPVLIDTLELVINGIQWNGKGDWEKMEIKNAIKINGELIEYFDPRAVTKHINKYKKGKYLEIVMSGNKVYIKCCSVRKYLYGNRLVTITDVDLNTYIENILSICESLGLSFNLANIFVKRCDLAKDFSTTFPPEAMIFEFTKLNQIGRKELNNSSFKYNNTYVCWNNTERALAVYNKKNEMKQRGCDVVPNGEWIRFEVRLLKKSSCYSEGLHTLDSLRDHQLQENIWERSVREIIDSARERNLFSNRCVNLNFIDRVNEVITTKNMFLKNLDPLILSAGGIENFLSLYNGQSRFEEYVSDLPYLKENRGKKCGC